MMWTGKFKPEHIPIMVEKYDSNYGSSAFALLTGIRRISPISDTEHRAKNSDIHDAIHTKIAPLLVPWDFYYYDITKPSDIKRRMDWHSYNLQTPYFGLSDSEILSLNLRFRALFSPPWVYYVEGDDEPIITAENKESVEKLIIIREKLNEKWSEFRGLRRYKYNIMAQIQQLIISYLRNKIPDIHDNTTEPPSHLVDFQEIIFSLEIPEILYKNILPYTLYKINLFNNTEIKIGEYNGRI